MAQLCHQHSDISATNTQTLVIAFGAPEQGRAWLQETGSIFPLLLDARRDVYRAYALERSLLRSWNVRTLLTYARLLAAGRRWRGIQGDSTQLGADFIVDTNGIVRLAHYSRDPADRPPVTRLLEVLRTAATEG